MTPQQGRFAGNAGQTIGRVGDSIGVWWWGLPAPHRRGFCAIVTGFAALLMFVGLLPIAHETWVAALSWPVVALTGWGAPFAIAAALAISGLIIAEAFLDRVIMQASWLWCGGIGFFLVLTESRVILGAPTGGLAGALGAFALHFLPPLAQHMLIIGGLLLLVVIAFRLTWAHLAQATQWVARRPASISATLPPRAIGDPHSTPLGRSPSSGAIPALPREPQAWNRTTPPVSSPITPRVISPEVIEHQPTPRYPYPFHFTAAEMANDAVIEMIRLPAYLRRDAQSSAATAKDTFPLPPLPTRPTAPEPPTSPLRPITPPLPTHLGNVSLATPPVVVRKWAQWPLPSLGIFHSPPEGHTKNPREHAERLAERLERTLKSFGVEAEVRKTDISIGPTIIRFGVRPIERTRVDDRGRVVVDAQGSPIVTRTRVSRIMNLKDDLALVLEVKTLRMEAPVPERPYVGIEIPNVYGRMVTLREMLESREYREALAKSKLTVVLGRDVSGKVRVGDLAKFPHLLIAGATGAGKSVCLNAIIGSLITQATPEEIRLVMIDPKMVELTLYDGIPHLLTPVITDAGRAIGALEAAIAEMERRYRLFSKLGARNLEGYDVMRAGPQGADLESLPRIVLIIDELADLMMTAADDIERHICRLAQLARATGIHLIVATQRPSVDVITGLIKANIPTRIAFMVSSAVDSRTILDYGGAERLLGKGDMLFLASDAAKSERIQGAFVADDEVANLALFWQQQALTNVAPAQWVLNEPSDELDDDDDDEWDSWSHSGGNRQGTSRSHGRHGRGRRG